MSSAITIRLFLPRGDAKSLRTAEISNWTGKAVAAPRTELDEVLACEELDKAGVYILMGSDPRTNAPRADSNLAGPVILLILKLGSVNGNRTRVLRLRII